MFSTFKTIIELLPLIISLVKQIESAFPDGGKGKEKLQMALSTLTGIDNTLSSLTEPLTKVITSVVTFYNTVGTFKK